MEYLHLENVSKSYGEKVLFSNIQLTISKGQKVAIVARNGQGKSTLLRIIAGDESVEGETATVRLNRDIRTVFLNQEPRFHDDQRVADVIFEARSEKIQAIRAYEVAMASGNAERIQQCLSKVEDLGAWEIEVRMRELLSKFRIGNLDQRVSNLSGGQRKRLALAQATIDDADFLILDEPTNHLDVEMIEWLETYLQRTGLTVCMVTHDRYFLDRICNEIIELDDGQLHIYRGNYTDFLEKKTIRVQTENSRITKLRQIMRRELEWIRRMPKARGTKAKARIDRFETLSEEASRKIREVGIRLPFKTARMGSKILEAHAIEKSFDDHMIIRSFSYKFKRGERLGIVGPNGAGKSTLINLLTGQLRPDGGKIVVGETVHFGYYHQDGLVLKRDKRVIDVIRDVAEYIPMEKGQKLTAEQLLEHFLFTRAHQQVYVSQLSGGERRRLYLLSILMQNPNFLILDEPTNDLDILTLNILEDYLLQFPGCLIVVSHDRYFMDKLVDHLFILDGSGHIRDWNGRYSSYRQEQMATSSAQKTDNDPKAPRNTSSRRPPDYALKRKLRKLEKSIEALEMRRAEIHERFHDTELSMEEISQLSNTLADVQAQLESQENEWLQLAEEL